MAFGANGEYTYVLRMSNNPALLVQLHSVRCSRGEAVALTEWLAARYPLDRPLRVFFAGHRGRSSVQGYNLDADEEIASTYRRISLPATEDLRIGIVIHEFVHQLVPKDGHGPEFVKLLDALSAVVVAPAETHPEAKADAAGVDFREYTKRSRCVRCATNTTRKHSKTGIPCCGSCETKLG